MEEALQHGKTFEPVARDLYIDVMKYHLNRDVQVRETGIVIQPEFYWLAASPDGLMKDIQNTPATGLLEIKCPKSKRNCTPNELFEDKSFYVGIKNCEPYLKKIHGFGYYTQIQMAYGISPGRIL